MKSATSVARPNLVSLGVCLGKMSKTGKFRLHITALEPLAQHAKYKVRVPPAPRLRSTAADQVEGRSGSSRTGRCRSCTGTTSSRPIWAASQRTRPNTRASSSFQCPTSPSCVVALVQLANPAKRAVATLRGLASRPGARSTRASSTRRPSSSSTRRASPFARSHVRTADKSGRDVGEYLRDEVRLFRWPPVRPLTALYRRRCSDPSASASIPCTTMQLQTAVMQDSSLIGRPSPAS